MIRRLALVPLLLLGIPALRAQQWIAPTPEELSMTAIPELPDAKAVILFRDELTDDDNHMRSRYFRVKILSEAGKDFGDVRIAFDRRTDGNGYNVSEIAGRTIQPDGTVVPFTGKPYEKVYEQGNGYKRAYKVFSMPAVQVGSILEYRYKLRWDDNRFFSPDWDIQTDVYLRKGHFLWRPTDRQLLSTSRGGHENITSALTWSAALPKGIEIKQTRLANQRLLLELNVQNVPPFGVEEFMPPIYSSAYHVYFYYSPYRSPQDFWKSEGKYWNGDVNKFIGGGGLITGTGAAVRDAATAATAGATGDEDKAKKLYTFVQTFENTDFSRQHSTLEDKGEGLKQTRSAEDVLQRKRGTSDQIALTYVALARAAGLDSSVMVVADRNWRTLNVNWLDFNTQLTDNIAVVNYAGKDHFLDPGSPFCAFGHLAWQHASSGGVLQQGKDTALTSTPGESYKDSRTTRIADLKLDETGRFTGTVVMTFQGSPAAEWRQTALRTDEAELREQFTKHLQQMLPGGSEASVSSIDAAATANSPLKVSFKVSGSMGSAAGSRVLLPSDIFVQHQQPAFPHATREQAVYFHYSQTIQDAMRVVYPPNFTLESAPQQDSMIFKQSASYSQRSKQTANSVTVWRDLSLGEFYYPLDIYPELRTFYSDFERKDHTPIVLKRSGPTAVAQSGQ